MFNDLFIGKQVWPARIAQFLTSCLSMFTFRRFISFPMILLVLLFYMLITFGVKSTERLNKIVWFSRFDNPASAAPFPTRHLTYNYLVALNGWLLSFPSALCCDWTMGTVSLVEDVFDPRNLGTLALFVLVGRMFWTAFLRGDTTVLMVNVHTSTSIAIRFILCKDLQLLPSL